MDKVKALIRLTETVTYEKTVEITQGHLDALSDLANKDWPETSDFGVGSEDVIDRYIDPTDIRVNVHRDGKWVSAL